MSGRTYWVNPEPGLRHGTAYAYYAKGCRCDRCYGWWHDHHEHRKAIDPAAIWPAAEQRRSATRNTSAPNGR